MQRRTPSPNTQSGVSAKSKAAIYVLSKPFYPFYARVSYKQRRSKTRTPTRHRRISTPRSGLGTVSVRLEFWKAEIQARTSVPLSGTCRSRRERPVRVLHGAFHTAVTTGTRNSPNLKIGAAVSMPHHSSAMGKLFLLVLVLLAPGSGSPHPRAGDGDQPSRIIFVGGQHHGGTSLVHLLLATDPA